MDRIAIPMQAVREQREARPRRPRFNGERAAEIYFTALVIVILGMIVAIAAYAAHSVIPAWQDYQSHEWQTSHFSRNLAYPHSDESKPPWSDRR